MHDALNLQRSIRQTLESLQRAGVTHLPNSAELGQSLGSTVGTAASVVAEERVIQASARPVKNVPAPTITDPAPAVSSGSPAMRPAPTGGKASKPAPTAVGSARPPALFEINEGDAPPLGPPLDPAAKPAALQVIQQEVAACTRCSHLASSRTQTVFGVGNPNARLLFVGEAPGADEDAQGEPFVGRAGQLLTDIITKGLKMRREDVYILNVLKCRPPGNRIPEPNEVINCRGFLDRQIDVIRPEFICCLGSVAAKTLLNSDLSIGRMRGKWHDYRGIPLLCTYHPAYLLRTPSAKREVWEDMKLLMARMGK